MVTLEQDRFTERLEELRETSQYHYPVREFVHEDGSHTFIVYDDEREHSNPRDYDGNVARLVQKHRDYIDLDDPDYGIEEARDRWGDESPLVDRYIAMFRPDIAYYKARWTVTGCSQSDWQYGYAYVIAEDVEKAGLTRAHHESRRMRQVATEAVEQELDIYGQWFAGEVYGGIHVQRGAPIVVLGDEGAYVDGYEADEDACWGFLGYENLKDICEQFTGSPVIEERWL